MPAVLVMTTQRASMESGAQGAGREQSSIQRVRAPVSCPGSITFSFSQ